MPSSVKKEQDVTDTVSTLRSEATMISLDVSVSPPDQNPSSMQNVNAQDVAMKLELDRRRNARLAVTQILAESNNLAEAACPILMSICENLSWDVGAVWALDASSEVLTLVDFWSSPGNPKPDFEADSRSRTFSEGVGLPGRIWKTCKPNWIPDVVSDSNFPRAPIAAKCQLHAAFAVPISVGPRFLGVIEFFSQQIREPDEDLLEMMGTIGHQIGQFIDRKATETRLRESETELSDFFQNAPIGFHWVDATGLILRVNQAELDFLGYEQDEYVGHHVNEFHVDSSSMCDLLTRVQQGETLRNFETRMRCKDGSIRIVQITANGYWRGKQFVHCRCFAQDITDRKLADEYRRATEQRFSGFMHHLPGLAWIKDLAGRYVYANDSARKIFCPDGDELFGKTDWDLFPAQTAAMFAENDRQALKNGIGIQAIETLEHEDGILHHSLVSKFPIFGADNTPYLVGGMAIDITERIRTEQALKEVESQLQIVVDSMSAPVTRCSRDLRYLWVSKSYANWLGMQPEDIIGHPIKEIVGKQAFDRLFPYFQRVLTGHDVSYEEEVRFRGVGKRWIHAVYSPTFDPLGKPDGWVAVVIDIDHRKRAEQDLKEANRIKDEFLAMLAHELRNPLAPIRNALQVMRMPDRPEEVLEKARDMADRQVQHMARLLDDLLDVSRISRGRIEIRKEVVEITALVNRTVEALRPIIEERQHRLVISLSPETLHVLGDLTRLEQILTNLLNNAAKYTDPGGQIMLSVERDAKDVLLRVRDTGIGIAPEMLPRVFDLFVQAERRLDRSQGGVGIGLTLVRKLVELHGGTVEAFSRGLGFGSEFVVRLPFHIAEPVRNKAREFRTEHARGWPSRRVLVVDDNQDAADSLALLLRISGQKVSTAYSGAEALQLAESQQPELVFLDIGMPGMDGYEVAVRLRQLPGLQDAKLIAVTGWGQDEDRRRTKEAGFNQHLVKPIDPAVLDEILQQ